MNDETTFELDKPEQNKPMVPAVRTKGALVPRDPFYAYLQEVRKYPALTEEEEKELAIRYKETGDLESAYKLTTANLMLVIKIAMTFKREWQNLMDLIQEGNVGLMKAVKNFDPFRGVRLSAYATWWIKSYILKHILDNWRLVRVGTTNARRKLLFNLKREKEKLEREGFDPTTKLLAERFGVDETEVIDVSASIGAMDVAIDTPVRPDSTMTPAPHRGTPHSYNMAAARVVYKWHVCPGSYIGYIGKNGIYRKCYNLYAFGTT